MNIKKTTFKYSRLIIGVILSIILLYFIAYLAIQFHLTDVRGNIDKLASHFNTIKSENIRKKEVQSSPKYWISTPEWPVIKAGLIKDKDIILRASIDSGVPARIILSSVIVEQFRYFDSNRALFKKIFSPLMALGNNTRFSYGVAGIKIGTAKVIEGNLKNPQSLYYLGLSNEHILDFSTNNRDNERMNRLTDSKDHYYSYLYTGLYMKEIMSQWSKKSIPLDNRPEVLATLFNLGFAHSVPKINPQVGGSIIKVNNNNYTFGGLAYEFYYSDELTKEFPN